MYNAHPIVFVTKFSLWLSFLISHTLYTWYMEVWVISSVVVKYCFKSASKPSKSTHNIWRKNTSSFKSEVHISEISCLDSFIQRSNLSVAWVEAKQNKTGMKLVWNRYETGTKMIRNSYETPKKLIRNS